jgi:hypothetical protein
MNSPESFRTVKRIFAPPATAKWISPVVEFLPT